LLISSKVKSALVESKLKADLTLYLSRIVLSWISSGGTGTTEATGSSGGLCSFFCDDLRQLIKGKQLIYVI
jgi:hypothetical protein